jgi:hypothetical protein
MADHTSTPWDYRRAKSPTDGEYDYGISAVINGRTYCIAETFGRCAIAVTPPADANAAFIVKACNAHADLVTALKGSDAMLQLLWERSDLVTRDCINKQAKLNREALAKAESTPLYDNRVA